MPTYYFDTSAIVKLYIPESGSSWTDQLTNAKDEAGRPLNVIAFTKIGIAETASAIARRERLGDINEQKRDNLYDLFINDCDQRFNTLAMTDRQIFMAASLTQKYPLKGYDAVHLASAILFNQLLVSKGLDSVTFISADRNLIQAASGEGLHTDDPNQYS